MNILGFLVIGIALFAGFVYHAMNECKSFKVDFSQAPSKVIVITGANSGLGYQTALELAKADAQLVLGCRSKQRCEQAKSNILKVAPSASITTFSLDLASFESIKEFANNVKENFDHIDVIVNNAGIMAVANRETTVDGIESQIGTNHFGHFLLTSLLYPILAKNGRIVNHSSEAHRFAANKFPLEDLQLENSYDPWVSYGNSKMANLYFTFELNKRLAATGNPKNIISIAVHPGYTATNLQKGRIPMWEAMNGFFAMNLEDGALAQIHCKPFEFNCISHKTFFF